MLPSPAPAKPTARSVVSAVAPIGSVGAPEPPIGRAGLITSSLMIAASATPLDVPTVATPWPLPLMSTAGASRPGPPQPRPSNAVALSVREPRRRTPIARGRCTPPSSNCWRKTTQANDESSSMSTLGASARPPPWPSRAACVRAWTAGEVGLGQVLEGGGRFEAEHPAGVDVAALAPDRDAGAVGRDRDARAVRAGARRGRRVAVQRAGQACEARAGAVHARAADVAA